MTYHSDTLVAKLDPPTRTLFTKDGQSLPYDVAVIATGSAPFIPPLDNLTKADGCPKDGAFVFRTVEDCQRIRAYARPASSAVVPGGWFLGLEAAKALSDLGIHVTVVHLPEWLMNLQVDRLGGEFVRKAVEKLGIFVRTGVAATGFTCGEKVEGVVLKTGDVLPASSCWPPACGRAWRWRKLRTSR